MRTRSLDLLVLGYGHEIAQQIPDLLRYDGFPTSIGPITPILFKDIFALMHRPYMGGPHTCRIPYITVD